MIDPNSRPDANPDSPPRDDDRGSVETLDPPNSGREDTIDNTEGAPDPRNGAVGGTDGMVKNQDDTAQ